MHPLVHVHLHVFTYTISSVVILLFIHHIFYLSIACIAVCGKTGHLSFEFPFTEFIPQEQLINFAAHVSTECCVHSYYTLSFSPSPSLCLSLSLYSLPLSVALSPPSFPPSLPPSLPPLFSLPPSIPPSFPLSVSVSLLPPSLSLLHSICLSVSYPLS